MESIHHHHLPPVAHEKQKSTRARRPLGRDSPSHAHTGGGARRRHQIIGSNRLGDDDDDVSRKKVPAGTLGRLVGLATAHTNTHTQHNTHTAHNPLLGSIVDHCLTFVPRALACVCLFMGRSVGRSRSIPATGIGPGRCRSGINRTRPPQSPTQPARALCAAPPSTECKNKAEI
jgi:hypothetical protein